LQQSKGKLYNRDSLVGQARALPLPCKLASKASLTRERQSTMENKNKGQEKTQQSLEYKALLYAENLRIKAKIKQGKEKKCFSLYRA
jgi:hypothetical protein